VRTTQRAQFESLNIKFQEIDYGLSEKEVIETLGFNFLLGHDAQGVLDQQGRASLHRPSLLLWCWCGHLAQCLQQRLWPVQAEQQRAAIAYRQHQDAAAVGDQGKALAAAQQAEVA